MSSFRFNIQGLRAALEGAGVESLRKLMPWFKPESVHTTNALGEEVLLEDFSTMYVASVRNGVNALNAVQALRDRPGTVYVEGDFVVHATALPNDPFFARQWGLHNTGQYQGASAETDIHAPDSWDVFTGGPGIWVGVLDTGIDSAHVDLRPWIRNGPNFINSGQPPADDDVAESHGTAVAGIIGAVGNNATGVAGVGWSPVIAAVKVLDASGTGSSSTLAAGIGWVSTPSRGIKLANLSLGSPDFSSTVYAATRNAALSGTFLIASMGNDNANLPIYPAAHQYNTVAVGALWWDRTRWVESQVGGCPGSTRGSNFGSWIDVCAPGGNAIATTRRLNGYYDMNPAPPAVPPCLADGFGSTSAATAFVSGVAALAGGYNQNLISDDFTWVTASTQAARDITQYGSGWDEQTGVGLLGADLALAFVQPPTWIEHGQLIPTDTDQVSLTMVFQGVPGLATGAYPTIRHRMRATHNFVTNFGNITAGWYRTSGTTGWPAPNPFSYNATPASWANVVSLDQNHITLDTFVFEVHSPVNGSLIGWFPATPAAARIAFSARGLSSVGIADQFAAHPPRLVVAPNPSSNRVSFSIDLPSPASTSLRIYNLGGRLVRVLANQPTPAGQLVLPWDGRNGEGQEVARGVYFYQLDVNGARVARDKLVITR